MWHVSEVLCQRVDVSRVLNLSALWRVRSRLHHSGTLNTNLAEWSQIRRFRTCAGAVIGSLHTPGWFLILSLFSAPSFPLWHNNPQCQASTAYAWRLLAFAITLTTQGVLPTLLSSQDVAFVLESRLTRIRPHPCTQLESIIPFSKSLAHRHESNTIPVLFKVPLSSFGPFYVPLTEFANARHISIHAPHKNSLSSNIDNHLSLPTQSLFHPRAGQADKQQ